MKTKPMPNTALAPSVICLGTERFGSDIPEDRAYAMLDYFVSQGGNFIDTAKVYGDWIPGTESLSEKTIGSWMASRRNRYEIVLATKGGHPSLDTMHIARLNESDIRSDIERSLTHLQTDFIDLYWLHRDDPSKPAEEIVAYMNKFVREGKIRYFGCSNWRSDRIEEARQYALRSGYQTFVASQTRWSLAAYPTSTDPTLVTMGKDEFDYHKRTGLPAVPYNAQASGLFSGRYTRDSLSAHTLDNDKVWSLCTPANLRMLERVEQLSRELRVGMLGVSLAALVAQPFPVYPIVGCKSVPQLADSCVAAEVTLDSETATRLWEI